MTRLYFVLCLVFTCSVSGQPPTYALVGLKVTLKPEITGTKQPDEILWKHNGNKVVEVHGGNQQEFGLFENRVTLDWISAELSITDLRLDDSGEYDLEVYADKVLKRQTLNLEVLEKLAQPNIKCEMIEGSSSTDGEEATLTCSLESRQPQSLTYEWISHGPGQRLTVPLSDKNKEYTCMVRNRLSNAAAKVTTKACFPDEGLSALIIGLSVLSVAALVAIVGIIIYCKKKNKACFKKDVETTSAERDGLNNEIAHNEERASLIHRTPTVPSGQRLGRQLLSNNYTTSDRERSDTENVKLCEQEIPAEGHVRKLAQKFEKNPRTMKLFQGTAAAPLRKSSCEGSNGSNEADAEQLDPVRSDQETQPGTNQPSCEGPDVSSNEKSDADAEQLDPSHSEQETEAGGDFTGLNSEAPQNKQSSPPSEPTAPSAQQPVSPPQDDTNMTATWDEPDNNNDQTNKEDTQSWIPPEENVQKHVSNFVNNPDNQTDTKLSFCAETKQLDPLHPEQGTEAGLNSEAPQNKQSSPPSEPTAPSAQQPVSPPQDDTNMTATCDEPDNNNDQDGQSRMPQKGKVQKLISNIENSPNNQTDQQKQVRKDGGEQPPVPRQKFPPVGTKVTTEHKEGTDSNQVTDKTEVENVELSESEKNNDPNKKSQTGKLVSDESKSDNNQSQSPPIPEQPDQSNCGELQESPDATHSDLDQQTQDKTGCDSPECEEQSDNTTVSKENKDKEEGDTDDNEGQCSAELKQSDKESDDEDIKKTKQSDKESEDEDTEKTRLEQSDNNTTVSKGDSEDEGDTDDNEGQCSAELKQSDKENENKDTEETRLEQSDEESEDEDTEERMLVKQPL